MTFLPPSASPSVVADERYDCYFYLTKLSFLFSTFSILSPSCFANDFMLWFYLYLSCTEFSEHLFLSASVVLHTEDFSAIMYSNITYSAFSLFFKKVYVGGVPQFVLYISYLLFIIFIFLSLWMNSSNYLSIY